MQNVFGNDMINSFPEHIEPNTFTGEISFSLKKYEIAEENYR